MLLPLLLITCSLPSHKSTFLVRLLTTAWYPIPSALHQSRIILRTVSQQENGRTGEKASPDTSFSTVSAHKSQDPDILLHFLLQDYMFFEAAS